MAHAPLKNSRGEIVGRLAVDEDSEEYFRRFIYYSLLTVVLGLLVLAPTAIVE